MTSISLRTAAMLATFWVAGLAAVRGQIADSLSLRDVYLRVDAGTPRTAAAASAARAAKARIGPARRLPDPMLQFALAIRS